MSHDVRGSVCPEGVASTRFCSGNRILVFFHEPGQVTFESDRASIAHRGGPNSHDSTSQHAATYAHATALCVHVKLHARSWEEPITCFDQRAPGGHVNETRIVPGSNPDRHDPVLLSAMMTTCATPIGGEKGHNGFHCLVVT